MKYIRSKMGCDPLGITPAEFPAHPGGHRGPFPPFQYFAEEKSQTQPLEMRDEVCVCGGSSAILCSERQWGPFEGAVEARQGGGGVTQSQSSLMTASLSELHRELDTNEFPAIVFNAGRLKKKKENPTCRAAGGGGGGGDNSSKQEEESGASSSA